MALAGNVALAGNPMELIEFGTSLREDPDSDVVLDIKASYVEIYKETGFG